MPREPVGKRPSSSRTLHAVLRESPEGLSPGAHLCNPLMSPGFAGSPPCPAQSLHVLPRAPWAQPPDELPAPEPLSQGPLWGPHPETHAHPTRP